MKRRQQCVSIVERTITVAVSRLMDRVFASHPRLKPGAKCCRSYAAKHSPKQRAHHRGLPRWKPTLLHYVPYQFEVVQKPVNHRGRPGGELNRKEHDLIINPTRNAHQPHSSSHPAHRIAGCTTPRLRAAGGASVWWRFESACCDINLLSRSFDRHSHHWSPKQSKRLR